MPANNAQAIVHSVQVYLTTCTPEQLAKMADALEHSAEAARCLQRECANDAEASLLLATARERFKLAHAAVAD